MNNLNLFQFNIALKFMFTIVIMSELNAIAQQVVNRELVM